MYENKERNTLFYLGEADQSHNSQCHCCCACMDDKKDDKECKKAKND